MAIEVDSANNTLAAPNVPTAANMMRPALPLMEWRVSAIDAESAPTAGAERSRPSAHGPACRMSRA